MDGGRFGGALFATLVLAACGGGSAPPLPPTPSIVDPPPSLGFTGRPPLEPVVLADEPPPPLAGGTLLVTADRHAVASDPDRDLVWVADLQRMEIAAQISLPGAEPGRPAEGSGGRLFVIGRRSGELVRLDPPAFAPAWAVPVCDAPRGVAWDATAGAVHVACAGGELVTLDGEDGSVRRRIVVRPDLRDVVVADGHLHVSRFRSAEVLVLDAEGAVVSRQRPETPAGHEPCLAWRMVAGPAGGVVLSHQIADVGAEIPLQLRPPEERFGFWPFQSAVTHIRGDDVTTTALGPRPLPVDVAVSGPGDFDEATVVLAGARNDDFSSEALVSVSLEDPDGRSYIDCDWECGTGGPIGTHDGRQVVAAAYVRSPEIRGVFPTPGEILVQTRDPWELVLLPLDHWGLTGELPDDRGPRAVALPGPARNDTGHDLFHEDAGSGVACASCHAEGGDDGRVWRFERLGPRRTQSIGGGLLGSEPFHWDGRLRDFRMLVDEVFTRQMGGATLPSPYVAALERFVDTLPAPPAAVPADGEAAARGQLLFERADLGCTGCHAGPRLDGSGGAFDVGTGGSYQAPSLLGLAARAPYLHDGCAEELRDVFRAPGCGSAEQHGSTALLDEAELDDLVAYLGSL